MDPFINLIQQSVMLDPFINAGSIHQFYTGAVGHLMKSFAHVAIHNWDGAGKIVVILRLKLILSK